ncbi:hypothetical protein B0H10DRAFT_1975617 [Mycena sp. CBHHK59/15]|nr:hypothetical protein B0H10DRAFT_1975617 [Mycena sp. CBHHK59/15]
MLHAVAARSPRVLRRALTLRSAVGLGCAGLTSGGVCASPWSAARALRLRTAMRGPSSPFVISPASGRSARRCARRARGGGQMVHGIHTYHCRATSCYHRLSTLDHMGDRRRKAGVGSLHGDDLGGVFRRTYSSLCCEPVPVYPSLSCTQDDVMPRSESDDLRLGSVNIDHSSRAHGSWGRRPRGWGERGWGYTSCPPRAVRAAGSRGAPTSSRTQSRALRGPAYVALWAAGSYVLPPAGVCRAEGT